MEDITSCKISPQQNSPRYGPAGLSSRPLLRIWRYCLTLMSLFILQTPLYTLSMFDCYSQLFATPFSPSFCSLFLSSFSLFYLVYSLPLRYSIYLHCIYCVFLVLICTTVPSTIRFLLVPVKCVLLCFTYILNCLRGLSFFFLCLICGHSIVLCTFFNFVH